MPTKPCKADPCTDQLTHPHLNKWKSEVDLRNPTPEQRFQIHNYVLASDVATHEPFHHSLTAGQQSFQAMPKVLSSLECLQTHANEDSLSFTVLLGPTLVSSQLIAPVSPCHGSDGRSAVPWLCLYRNGGQGFGGAPSDTRRQRTPMPVVPGAPGHVGEQGCVVQLCNRRHQQQCGSGEGACPKQGPHWGLSGPGRRSAGFGKNFVGVLGAPQVL